MDISGIDPAAASGGRTAAATSLPGTSELGDGANPQLLSDQFLQLLVAQLQNQNPLNPRDGAEFLADLVQLSSLQELVQIREFMEGQAEAIAAVTPQLDSLLPESSGFAREGEPGASAEGELTHG